VDEFDARVAVSTCSRRILRVVAEADPGVLARVIDRFQNQSIVPRRVVAEVGSTGSLYIQVEVVGMPESLLTLITNKLRELPCVLNSDWDDA
jgi:hypothetical protein